MSRVRELAWRVYEHLPRSADPPLRLATRALLPFTRAHLPLEILRGPVASGGFASMLVAGEAEYLVRRFFSAAPARESLGSLPIWRLGRELARRRSTVDLVVARLDRVSAALALDPSFVAVPEWVGGLAPVPTDVVQLCRANKSMRNNLRRMEQSGFEVRVSHDWRDFDDFYDRMYVPFIRHRHGAETMTSNRSRMRRCFRQGGLIFAVHDGRRAAGVLYRTRGRTFDLVVVGTAEGDLGPVREGAAFALDVFAFQHAHALGCEVFDFGGSRPSPTDGLVAYKARWGTRVVANRTLFYELHLGWERLTPPLLAFFARTPLIFRQADGLAALGAHPPGARETADLGRAHRALEGLRRLYVLGPTGDPPAWPLDLPVIAIDPVAHPTWQPPARAQS